MTIFGGIIDRVRAFFGWGAKSEIRLRHFEDIWPVELAAINLRRNGLDRGRITRNRPPRRSGKETPAASPGGLGKSRRDIESYSRPRSPDPDTVFNAGTGETTRAEMGPGARADKPDAYKLRPQPAPCDAIGLCLSGGGIRSAAVGLGGLQALASDNWLCEIDYLSTVSGGGYIGSSLSAAMSEQGGSTDPFGTDVFDSDAVAHLRNFSNYLMPRGNSGLRNGAEGAAILLRGLLANFIILMFFELTFALLTRLLLYNYKPRDYASLVAANNFRWSLWSGLALGIVLTIWAIYRSMSQSDIRPSDTRGPLLRVSSTLLVFTAVIAFINLQPILIGKFIETIYQRSDGKPLSDRIGDISAVLSAFSAIIAFFSSSLGKFLQKSQRSSRVTTLLMRGLAKIGLLAAAALVPMLLWLGYIWLSAALLEQRAVPPFLNWMPTPLKWSDLTQCYLALCVLAFGVTRFFRPNGYSLHRFYRDRLSKAFLFKPTDSTPLDDLKLSGLQNGKGPYHILNAALNIQGSVQANYRGRDADFFIFTPDFVGSDLTMYTTTRDRSAGSEMPPTRTIETIDPALDLATAMAISGAAISANMGSNTIRELSPTLALLNIRLGYWMKNPRGILLAKGWRWIMQSLKSKLYLLVEILNLHDETSPKIYLTDGGHIENLGLYELLKRGCRTIIVIDAEADPEMAFPSLLKLERHARIDLGVRIDLPWEHIARASAPVDPTADDKPTQHGPHCALGTITYADGAIGKLLYFKSSITGDEKDYILDYRRRNSDFPHETTGDQFFSEEQFEMYRALGFHMIDRTLGMYDAVARETGDPVALAPRELKELFPQRTMAPVTPRKTRSVRRASLLAE